MTTPTDQKTLRDEFAMAALTGLYKWNIDFDDEPGEAVCVAHLWHESGSGSATAPTPALALLAAMLRAKIGEDQ